MPSRVLLLRTVFFALPLVAAPAAHAEWSSNYGVPVFLTAAGGDQTAPASVSDGAGGAIVAWQDARPGALGYDIYVQRVSATGVPLWTADGVALCTATGGQTAPMIVTDGSGGAIVTWMDDRMGISNTDIYAQRVDAAGTPQWTADGVPVCAAGDWQFNPRILEDGAGGAFLAWEDWRGSSSDIYAQRINAAGAPQWAVNGVAVCAAIDAQYGVALAADAADGIVLAWSDLRSGFGLDIHAQRLNGAGVPQWSVDGVAACDANNDQRNVQAVADGFGGVLLAWEDERNALNTPDVYAQHLSPTGGRRWASLSNGIALCTAFGSQVAPRAIGDGAGGMIVAWTDTRQGDNDIYAQRVAASGAVLWTADGAGVWAGANDQSQPALVSDGSGGALFAYRHIEFNPPYYDMYARRLDGTGTPVWTNLVHSGLNDQVTPTIVSDGIGGAIVTCRDGRNGNNDISAQRMARFGRQGMPEPAITSAGDVPGDQGGSVRIEWSGSYVDWSYAQLLDYRVWRSVPTAPATFARMARLRGLTRDPEEAAATGRLLVGVTGAQGYAWEPVGLVPATQAASYSFDAPTTADSIGGSNPLTAFMVQARESNLIGGPYWYSWPDSGYSVDNLPPATPSPFTGEYDAGVATLHWNPNTEPDLAGYRIYRGSSADFVPGPGNLIAAKTDTGHVDNAGDPYFYKLAAVDVHGNESAPALYAADATTDVQGPARGGWSLAPPVPNPAHGRTVLHLTLPQRAAVRLAVYDPAGRRVRTLHDGPLSPGAHSLPFALEDDSGRALASGIYLIRLEAPGRVLTRRMAAIR